MHNRRRAHAQTGGFYVQPEYLAYRATQLGYDPNGKLAVGYMDWGSGIGSFDFSLNASTTLGGYSTWNFNRLTFLSTFRSKKIYGIMEETQRLRGQIQIMVGPNTPSTLS